MVGWDWKKVLYGGAVVVGAGALIYGGVKMTEYISRNRHKLPIMPGCARPASGVGTGAELGYGDVSDAAARVMVHGKVGSDEHVNIGDLETTWAADAGLLWLTIDSPMSISIPGSARTTVPVDAIIIDLVGFNSGRTANMTIKASRYMMMMGDGVSKCVAVTGSLWPTGSVGWRLVLAREDGEKIPAQTVIPAFRVPLA